MRPPLIKTLIEARAAGLVLRRGPDGKLIVRGPRAAEDTVRAVLARKAEILAHYVDLYSGSVDCLNWRSARVADRAKRCILCSGWAILRDPVDNLPTHKVCAEQQLRAPQITEGAA